MSIDLAQFFQTFFEEATDHLADMERLLLHMDTAAPTADELDSVFRAAHSIKGGAGIFGFTRLSGLTHVLESHLDLIRSGKARMTEAIADELLQAVDYLRLLLQCCRDSCEPDEAEYQGMLQRFEQLGSGAWATSTPPATALESEDGSFGLFAAPLTEADEGFGFFASPPAPAQVEEAIEGFGLFAPLDAAPPTAVDEGFGFFEPMPGKPLTAVVAPAEAVRAAAPAREAGKPAPAPDAASIRVSVERVDQLINLVGELVITQAMLAETGQHVEGPVAERLQNSLNLLERNTRDLQEAVMSIRMLPISFVFNRFPRVVRDLSHKLGKGVELVIQGEGTELDRGLIEKLVDPLTHLVRNSIDHGIESPEKRRAAGKPERGTVVLRASQQGGNIVVEVSDDGAGLNRERILAKALENGLPVNEAMADADVWQMIFAPGFSTAAEVTDVSGRGVGMDVVKRNIADLGGRIEISSVAGQGASFIIRLPLTLAILDGMSVAVGQEVFIIPLTYILESLQPGPGDIRRVAGKGEVVHVRGDYLPLIPLFDVLGLRGVHDPATRILLLVQAGEHKAALQVDDLLGQHQVVIKSLESNYRRVPGVSGATVMGDGRVALILDVADIVHASHTAQAA
ncbi:chemotaxis protein CheA [Uliginosibacterium aquaticum]|uniref:Chemotaxis protein CheA n=1 Tax=Uliginosibacterium aquaticum TaxID=2731212 RepID=A0ABX2IJD2_9RHOO|nr:chemotaxis protein CheW [Uliginosibacterium aquaticum]NSL56407.1 chemotaxis protein CheW [Uliginosibacterium aquaticum]